ncbi:hypothetical protein OH77DRAFT_1422770 [Trametes cingulata]|nr:hypothetical protein OH77DRAFT_1422770 [Trametes cingulata]
MSFQYDHPSGAQSISSSQSPLFPLGNMSTTPHPMQAHGSSYSLGNNLEAHPSDTVAGSAATERGENETTQLCQWCERLSNQWGLKDMQYDDLKQIVNLGTRMDEGQLRIALWNQTTLYRLLNTVESQAVDQTKFLKVLEDTQEMLVRAWTVSNDQGTTLRITARDLLIEAGRTSYTELHLDVLDYITINKVRFGFEDVFAEPAREATLRLAISKKCSNARTTLRNQLIKSISGKSRKSLEEATLEIFKKMKKGGVGAENITAEHQIRLALLRRWTRELLGLGLPPSRRGASALKPIEGVDDSSGDVWATYSAPAEPSAPQSKKRKADNDANAVTDHSGEPTIRPTVGKTPKGEDFWSKIDAILEEKLHLWGDNMKESDDWRDYIDATISRDRQLFGSSKSRFVTPLPLKSIPIVLPLDGPSTTHPAPSEMMDAGSFPSPSPVITASSAMPESPSPGPSTGPLADLYSSRLATPGLSTGNGIISK